LRLRRGLGTERQRLSRAGLIAVDSWSVQEREVGERKEQGR